MNFRYEQQHSYHFQENNRYFQSEQFTFMSCWKTKVNTRLLNSIDRTFKNQIMYYLLIIIEAHISSWGKWHSPLYTCPPHPLSVGYVTTKIFRSLDTDSKDSDDCHHRLCIKEYYWHIKQGRSDFMLEKGRTVRVGFCKQTKYSPI